MPYLDMFLMVSATPVSLLRDYYQLTGNPVLLPKFAFYEGHLNAYNRDYWKETTEKLEEVYFLKMENVTLKNRKTIMALKKV